MLYTNKIYLKIIDTILKEKIVNKRQKSICIWICLLILLIILCTLTHLNGLTISKPEINATITTPAVVDSTTIKSQELINSTPPPPSTNIDENSTPLTVVATNEQNLEAQTQSVALPEVNQTVVETNITTEANNTEEHTLIETEINKAMTFGNINFENNQVNLTTNSLDTLVKIATILKEHSNVTIEIGGHTDNVGSANYNLKLSQKRVDNVKSVLIKQGIEQNRITSIGYGETRPLVPNESKANREKNRRVEFKIIGE